MSEYSNGYRKAIALLAAAVMFLSAGAGLFQKGNSTVRVLVAHATDDLGVSVNNGVVTISDDVTSIDCGTYRDWMNITSVSVSSGNPSFASKDGVLYNKSMTRLIYYPVGRKGSFKIPESVTSIGQYAFSGCRAVQYVDDYDDPYYKKLYGCTGLTGITIPDSVTTIQEGAFLGCMGLTSVTIPDSVTALNRYAFSYCKGMTDIHIGHSVRSVGSRAFEHCTKLQSVEISDSVTSVGTYAFESCTALERVVIGNSVTSISLAFSGCTALKNVTIGKSLASVSYHAFRECTGLTDIVIPDSVTSIGEGAFYGCTGLTGIRLPDSVTSIGQDAFCGCTGLADTVIPDSVDSIGVRAFAGCTRLTDIVIPDSVTSIGSHAFYGCTALENVSIGNAANTLKWDVFYRCDKLKNVTFLACVYSVGNRFSNCKSLASITVYNSVSSIAEGAFNGCDNLTDVYFHGTEEEWRILTVDSAGNALALGLDNAAVHFLFSGEKITITQQPADVSAKVGNAVSFSVAASGNALGYQWYYRKKGASDWNVWKSRTAASVTATANATWNGMQVRCRISNKDGSHVYSRTVSVQVTQDLKIIAQPQSRTVHPGDNVALSVKAEGIDLTYQWYYRKAGQSSWNIWKGHTAATTAAAVNSTWDGIRFCCRIMDSYGNSVDSDIITLTFARTLKIMQQPSDKTVRPGDTVTLSLKADGNGLTYQWYYRKTGQTSWNLWKGHIHPSETVMPNATWNGIQLFCKIRDSAGHTVDSDTVRITLIEKITVELHPETLTVSCGCVVTFSVKASGSGLKYQWYYRKAGQTSWNLWKGHTTAATSAAANATWDGMDVRCIITDSRGNTVTYNAPPIRIK